MFFYHHIFLLRTAEKPTLLREIIAIDHHFLQEDKWTEQVEKLGESLKESTHVDEKQGLIDYIIREYFTDAKEIDHGYIDQVTQGWEEFAPKMSEIVNPFADSFPYEQMDAMTQALLLLGYSEWKYLATPSKILLNELVELAKRYGVNGAPQLVNAIGHQMIQELP